MKIKLLITCTIVMFSMSKIINADDVAPIRNAYGNVFPEISHQTLDVFRSSPGPTYVSFTLLTPANIKLGAAAFTSSDVACCFNISSIRLVTIDGRNVAFGSDIISENPFPSSITHLVVRNNLDAGKYALEVSGSGNRTRGGLNGVQDAVDFITRLSITSPSTDTEYEQGRLFGRQECINNPANCGISVTGEATLTEDLKMNIPVLNWNTPQPSILWADLEYVPNDYSPEPNDILFKVTDYGVNQ